MNILCIITIGTLLDAYCVPHFAKHFIYIFTVNTFKDLMS